MDDVIHEQDHNVLVYTNISIKWDWIFLVKGEEVISNWKTSKIVLPEQSFFANLATFERRSGLKNFFPSQNRDFENGVIVKISKS